MRTLIYMDESGDLGWTFTHPYQKGGSSRYVTLAAVCVPEGKEVHIQRIVRTLYKKRKRPLSKELKSVDINHADKALFLRLTGAMLKQHPDISLRSITVSKAHVHHNRRDQNQLYNYATKLLLLKTLCQTEYVDFIPDRRCERVNAKWNMAEYLNQMIYEASLKHQICNRACTVTPMDSSKEIALQFIDFYAGLVWACYEFGDSRAGHFMSCNRVTNYKLFFPKEQEEADAQVFEL